MSYFPYAFETIVEPHDLGTYRYTVVFLDDALIAQVPFDAHPRLRISGEINDQVFTGAWQPSRGRWYLMLSKKLLRAAELTVGSSVEVRFRVELQDKLDVPALLQTVIDADAQRASTWDALTIGKRRALAYRVASAKTSATVIRRVGEVSDWLDARESDLRRLGKVYRRAQPSAAASIAVAAPFSA